MPRKVAPSKEFTKLTKAQEAEVARIRSYFPYRIIYAVVDKDTKAFSAHASTDMRTPNRLARAGHIVLVVKR